MDSESPTPTPPPGSNPSTYGSHLSDIDRRSSVQPPPAQPGPSHLPSLPSIHQLHPNLPPSAPAHRHPMAPAPPYPSGFASGSAYPHGLAEDMSEQEGEAQGPPKKKRRRQALSCTECKRRKIKCDRAQPCGPCSRRGEQTKCQWHIIEPMEKYVTRQEFDDLKGRFDQLEARLAQILPMVPGAPHPNSVSPTLTAASALATEPAHPAPMHGYRAPPPAGSPAYRLPSSPPDPPFPGSSSSSGSAPPRSPQAAYRIPLAYTRTHPSPPRAPSPAPPLSSSSRLPDARAPTSRRASLSLAAITTPFTPPKNRNAQTPPHPLGQRLRTPRPPPSGPAPAPARAPASTPARAPRLHIRHCPPTSHSSSRTRRTGRPRLWWTRAARRMRCEHSSSSSRAAIPASRSATCHVASSRGLSCGFSQ